MMSGWEKSFLDRYSRSLWWFLRFRWVSALIWVVCLAGTVWLFMVVPKAFLPPGDSSFIFGVDDRPRRVVARADARTSEPRRRNSAGRSRVSEPLSR